MVCEPEAAAAVPLSPPLTSADAKRPGARGSAGAGPLGVARVGGHRLCWESATVTSTRWNSFSSL